MNMLLRAARCNDRDFAATLLVTILHIKGEEAAQATLPEPAEWRAMPVANRLQALAGWLTAECHTCIDGPNPDAGSAVEHVRVPARALMAGDVVGSGETVLSVTAGLRTPAGKVHVALRRSDGSTRGATWGAATQIPAARAR